MSLLRAFVVLLSVASAAYLPPNEIFARGDEGQCAVTPQNQPEWYERNLRTVRKIYDMTVYPSEYEYRRHLTAKASRQRC